MPIIPNPLRLDDPRHNAVHRPNNCLGSVFTGKRMANDENASKRHCKIGKVTVKPVVIKHGQPIYVPQTTPIPEPIHRFTYSDRIR